MRQNAKREAEIIDLKALKEQRLLQRSLDEYQGYLQGLGVSQMESEALHLLEEFSGQNFGPDYLQKVQLLLGELSARADGGFQLAIDRLSSQLPRL